MPNHPRRTETIKVVNGGELDGTRILSPTTVDLFTINHAPAAALYGLLMTQHSPNNDYPLADTFKQLTYQALVK